MPTPDTQESDRRGVFYDSIQPDGEQWWTLVTSSGKVGIVHLPDELVATDTESYLCKLLDSMDPVTRRHLQVVAPSSRPRKSRRKSAPPTLTIC